jgi:hypothetical protein
LGADYYSERLARPYTGTDETVQPKHRPFQAPRQEAPKVLHRVCVDVSVNVLNRVVYDFMLVLFAQAHVGWQFIGEDCRSRFHVLFELLVKFRLS